MQTEPDLSADESHPHSLVRRDGSVVHGGGSHPKIFVNGRLAGEWAYGYASFRVDLCLVIVRSPPGRSGEIVVTVEADGLAAGSVGISSTK